MSTFDDLQFSGVYPISFLMRERLPGSWFRIHSLPESKQYADTAREWETLMQRHREFSSLLLEEGSSCRIYYSLFEDRGVPSELSKSLDWSRASVVKYDDECVYTYTSSSLWRFDDFMSWVKLRSDDVIGTLSFHSLETDAIYSPYDGGADGFSLNPGFINRVRREFSKWKSKHPKGL